MKETHMKREGKETAENMWGVEDRIEERGKKNGMITDAIIVRRSQEEKIDSAQRSLLQDTTGRRSIKKITKEIETTFIGGNQGSEKEEEMREKKEDTRKRRKKRSQSKKTGESNRRRSQE